VVFCAVARFEGVLDGTEAGFFVTVLLEPHELAETINPTISSTQAVNENNLFIFITRKLISPESKQTLRNIEVRLIILRQPAG